MNQDEMFRQIKNAATENLRELMEFEGPYLQKFGCEERLIDLDGFTITVNEKVFGYAKSELARRGELSCMAGRQCSRPQDKGYYYLSKRDGVCRRGRGSPR
jgi:hypothetical protein